MASVVSISDMDGRDVVRHFEGRDHGAGASCYLVMGMPAGGGPQLHVHPYSETFVLHDGTATFTAGDETVEAAAGQVVFVPPNTPHKFVAGEGGLSMVTIHASDHMVQEDLPEDAG